MERDPFALTSVEEAIDFLERLTHLSAGDAAAETSDYMRGYMAGRDRERERTLGYLREIQNAQKASVA